MLYQFKCIDCEDVQVIKCSVADRPDTIGCGKCGKTMIRDFQGEGKTFHLKGGGWASDSYARGHNAVRKELDDATTERERIEIKRDKANGTYQKNC